MKILVVDDNKDFCENVKDVTEMAGHHALCAYAGATGIQVVTEQHPDVVLLDVKMPDMDGVEALQKMKEIAPQTPVIMVSGFSEEEMIGQARSKGALGFLQKPIDFNKLFILIEGITGQKN